MGLAHDLHDDDGGHPDVSPKSAAAVVLDQIRDPSRQSPAHTPTAVLGQLRDRIQAIALDMGAVNQSCNVDSIATRAPQAPADELPRQSRKRRQSARTVHHERATFHCSVTHSVWLKTDVVKHESGQLSLARVLLNTQARGGYGGIRVGEAQSSGPAACRTRQRDWTVTEQPNATHRRINEAGDSVPSSQDSVTRAVQNLRISELPAAPAALPSPVELPNSGRRSDRTRQAAGLRAPPGLGDGTRGALSLDTPRLGQKDLKEPGAVTNPGLCSAASVVACFLLKSRKVSTGTPS